MKETFIEKINTALDSSARAEICILHWRHFSAFHFWGIAAIVLAVVSALTMVEFLDLSFAVMGAIILAVPLTVFVLGMSVKLVTGEEQHAHYHYALAISGVTTAILLLANQPILSYLDTTVFGIAIFLAVGRVGCFMVGCCHGRPSTCGVRYGREHAEAGFNRYYVGVRLFPVQLIESLLVLLIVGIGALLLFKDYAPGAFLAWYVVVYGATRFWIEFLRGDPGRPYLLGYSEPQWTSLLLMSLTIGAEYFNVLPARAWHFVVTASVVVAMIVIAWKRSLKNVTSRGLLYPSHIQEVAQAIEVVTGKATEFARATQWSIYPRRSDQKQILIASTSLGIQLSASRIGNQTDESLHYAFSHRDGGMTGETARQLAQLILTLRRVTGSPDMRSGGKGVFHLFVQSPRESGLGHL